MIELPLDLSRRFEIRRRLGDGAAGVVYEAFDRELQQRVALKTLRHADGVMVARFKREFRALHDLVHPNIVALGEFFEGEAEPFFTMELVEGVSFLDHVRGRGRQDVAADDDEGRPAPGPHTCDEARLRAALAQLAAGVAALHDAGMVHRDIKPSNVLVTDDGRVVLLDFGLVAEAAGDARAIGGMVVGTAAYMAPEQALAGQISPAADWYAVGVVLFEALTGQLPHDGRTGYELLINKQERAAPPPRQLVPTVPADLDALCAALLQARAADRPDGADILRRLGAAPPRRDTADVAPTGAPAAFVGRAAELARLQAAYDDSRDRPLICLVEGISGVGKSQLVEHFLAQLSRREPAAVVLAGRCYEREVVPFKALDGVAEALARWLERLPPAQVAALLPARPALLARLFPVLKRVEAIAAAELVADVPDPHDQRLRMFGALRELFLAVARRGRLVWFIDDLQWMDADSLVLLQDLLTHVDTLPVLVIATARPVDDARRKVLLARVTELAPTVRLPLDELTAAEARELAGRLLPDHDPAALDALAADAGGLPLFLQELARRATRSPGAAAGGATLDQMLADRIAQLPAQARTLLEVVSVFGGPLPQDVAALAAELSVGDEHHAATLLRAAHLVRTEGVRRTDRIVPYHDRVREHVCARLDDARQARLHERLAIALEQTGAAEQDPRALVRHARAAGRRALAASAARSAARHAVAALAFDQAAQFLAEALELDTYDEVTLRELRIDLATTLMYAGRGPEAAETFMAAADAADPAVRLDCQRQAAEQWIITGHLDQGMAALRSSLADIGEPLAATPRRALARVLWNRARARLRGTRHVLRHDSQVPVETLRRLDVLKAVAHGLAMVDNIRGADFNGRFLLLALQTGEPRRLVAAMATEVVFLASQAGAAGRRARRLYAELTEVAAHCPDRDFARVWLLLADGAASFFEGRFAPALASLGQTEEIFATGPRGLTYERNNTRVFRIHALRVTGALRTRDALITELVRTGRQRGDRYLETTLRLLQGDAVLARDDVAEARSCVEHVTWSPAASGFHLQHWYELRARADLALYEGTAAASAAALAPVFEDLDRSMLLRVKIVRADAVALRARLLVAAAAEGRAPDGLGPAVRRAVRQLEREQAGYATIYALLLRAALASLDGDAEEELRCLRQAIDHAAPADMALHLAAARHRLGALLGGDEGAALRAAAAAYAAREGVVRPERMYQLVLPARADNGRT